MGLDDMRRGGLGENKWDAMPFYQKVNHLFGKAIAQVETHVSSWFAIVFLILFLHKDSDPQLGWIQARIKLIAQFLQVRNCFHSFQPYLLIS